MRVVVTCDWFLKYAAEQTAALARTGAEVALLCRDHAFEFGGDRDERAATLAPARSAGVQVLEIPGRLRDPVALPSLLALRRQLARWRPQVVHAHDGADARALAILPRVPAVLTLHDPVPHPGQPVPPSRKRWFLHGSRDAWRERAQIVIVHSESLRPEVALARGQRLAVIPHGLRALSRPLPPPAIPAIGFFGRLTPYKGLEVLASAMPLVWASRPETHLRLAGAGEVQFPLRDERVHIRAGYLPEAEFEAFFSQTTLSVLPYTQASQTGAGSVAVGHGVPVVVTRVGGLPDLALDETYAVAPGDPGALAHALVRHLGDGADVRERVLRELAGPRTWDAAAAQSLELYRSLA